MKSLLFLFLVVGTPSFIRGLENDRKSSTFTKKKLIEPNTFLPEHTNYTGCGGVIPISPIFDSVIEYKWGGLYDPWEFCVWTLVPGDKVTNVRVTVISNFADNGDGITAYFLNSTGITSLPLQETRTNFDFNTPLAFLVFNSNDYGESTGFYIFIDSTGDSGPTSSTAAFHVRKDEGEFSYPTKDPRRNRDKAMALVLQRKTRGLVQTHLELNIENVTIDEKDSIQVYNFNSYFWEEPLVLIGRLTNDATFQVHSRYPVLILLESETKNLKGKSFRVEWKEYPNSMD